MVDGKVDRVSQPSERYASTRYAACTQGIGDICERQSWPFRAQEQELSKVILSAELSTQRMLRGRGRQVGFPSFGESSCARSAKLDTSTLDGRLDTEAKLNSPSLTPCLTPPCPAKENAKENTESKLHKAILHTNLHTETMVNTSIVNTKENTETKLNTPY